MKHLRLLIATATLGALATFTVAVRAQVTAPDKAELALRVAMEKESVAGDLKAAIEEYRKIATTYAKSNRTTAARALLRMGQCYEKLGNDEARKAYQQLLSQYGDLKETAEVAKVRLAAMGAGGGGTPTARRVIDSGPGCSSVSVDGRYCPVSDYDGHLSVRDLTTGEERRIAGVPDEEYAYQAEISPDGKWIAYGGQPAGDSLQELRVAGMDGTRPRTVFKTGKESQVGWVIVEGWSPDAKEVLVTFNRSGSESEVTGFTYHVGMISLETGHLRVLKEFDFGFYRWASISPDGRWVAYNVQPSPDNVECDIYVIRTDGTGERKLLGHPADDIDPVWTPDGRGLVFRSNRRGSIDVWFQAVKDGAAQGEPLMIKADVPGALHGVTRQGTIYYASAAGSCDINVATLDASTGALVGAVEKLPLAYTGQKQSPVISPDGTWLAYLRPSLRTPRVNVVMLRSMKTGEERELNPKVKDLRNIKWYPDGRSLVLLGRNMKDYFSVFRMDAATGEATFLYGLFRINGLNMNFTAPSVAPDGRTVYPPVSAWSGDHDAAIIALNSETKEFQEIFRQKGGGTFPPSVSPDGQYLAALYTATEGAPRLSLRVVNSQTGAMRELSAVGPNARVAGWTPDSRNVLVVTPRNGVVWRITLDGGDPRQSAIPGITVPAQSAANRLVWITGDTRSELWALDNAIPAK